MDTVSHSIEFSDTVNVAEELPSGPLSHFPNPIGRDFQQNQQLRLVGDPRSVE